nr:DNA-directed RNA polymerase I subunit RPA43 [Tanacetum cinerariifolium]
MEGLKISEAELMVYLHPSKSKYVTQAIDNEFSSMLFKYDETFDGVLLAYSASTQNELGKILPGLNPYFGVKTQAQLLLFYPKPDMLLEGEVVKLGEHSIHIIVLEEDIREEFTRKVKHGEEVYASTVNRRHKIEVGTIVRFQVKSFDEEILHISGSLLQPHTGSVSWLDKHAQDANAESNIKKRKGREADNISVSVVEDPLSLKTDHKNRKSKKHSKGSSR